EPGGHVVRITPLKDFARGNLVVRLLKLTTPITFSLQAGGDKVDYRFDARVPEYGPNAKIPLVDDGIKSVAGDKVTTAFLEGVPPSGAQKLTVEGVEGHTAAWRFAGALYVRTPFSLFSPAWQGSATSADGMNVYVMDEAPVLLMSDKGNLVRARLSEVRKIRSRRWSTKTTTNWAPSVRTTTWRPKPITSATACRKSKISRKSGNRIHR